MATVTGSNGGVVNKFKLTRRGRKLQGVDPQSVLAALPKDVPERTWADILLREDLDQFLLELREELFDAAMDRCHERYMERQTVAFTAHCAAKAWIQLIDWYFYRHDPGEEPSSYPPCCIPKRTESWTPDAPPEASPKDPWCRAELPLGEVLDQRPSLERWPSSSSLTLPKLPEIPRSCWFPGKVKMPSEIVADEEELSGSYDFSDTSPPQADSEVLQRVTDYSDEELTPSVQEQATLVGDNETEVPGVNVDSSLQGGGDSLPAIATDRRRGSRFRSKVYSRAAIRQSRSGALATESQQTVVSDCRLRSLKLDTRYEISAEKLDSPLRSASSRRKP